MTRPHVHTAKRKHPSVAGSDPVGLRAEAHLAEPGAKPISSASPDERPVDPTQREAMIRKAAYLRAERRGFAMGKEVEDWLAAEADVDSSLTSGDSAAHDS
jgi:hypothetical protein